jgi:hypothetical protein
MKPGASHFGVADEPACMQVAAKMRGYPSRIRGLPPKRRTAQDETIELAERSDTPVQNRGEMISHRLTKFAVSSIIGAALTCGMVTDASATPTRVFTRPEACVRAGNELVASGAWSVYDCQPMFSRLGKPYAWILLPFVSADGG